MKLFALYLPQFHEIKENNEWWGKGFTEWTNVKNAKPLFKGHSQPKEPLDNNYYNLLERETIEWQTSLMKDSGIYGMIYYHYYFNGRMLLEKPAENLLLWKDIDQPFFFCWANHTWNRAWKGSKEVLIEQTYGLKEDWKKHFLYFLNFFKDSRYEKIDNKPVLMIYQPDFKEKTEMMNYFDELAIENGFNGIYLIEECSSVTREYLERLKKKSPQCTAKYFFPEPLIGKNLLLSKNNSFFKLHFNGLKNRLRQKGFLKKVPIIDGNKVYETIINNEPFGDEYIHSIFFEWDNTPRHGFRGFIITPPTKEKFIEYTSKIKNDDMIFINAWNEWAEGMILEPTKETNNKYLKWIKEVLKDNVK